MNFDLLDEAMLNDGFGGDINFDVLRGGSLNISDTGLPPDGIDLREFPRERGIKRGDSWDDLVRCVSDESVEDITKDERDELQEFLKDVGISTSPAPPEPDAFECWGASISPISEEHKVESGSMAYPFEMSGDWPPFPMSPPDKRRRLEMPSTTYPVTPPASPPDAVVSMPTFMPDRPPISSPQSSAAGRKGKDTNKNRTTRQFVPFEEMQRLMAEYGPIKTPRKRKTKTTDENGHGGSAKVESIKRKFYRWFPDFEERLVMFI